MIIINNSKIIDIRSKHNVYGLCILNNSIIFSKQGIQIQGATEINTGDSSKYALFVNNVLYTDITISNIHNSEDIEIVQNTISFNKAGTYEVELIYDKLQIQKRLQITVKDVTLTFS